MQNKGSVFVKEIFLDISTQVMYIALVENNQILDEAIRIGNRDHAAYVIDYLDQLLKRNHQTFNDISSITVGKGPGSYTGIRIAVTVAKTFAYTKHIELYEVSSLIFMTSGYEALVCAMIDARRECVFYTMYEKDKVYHIDAYRLRAEVESEAMFKKSKPILIDEHTYKINIDVINLNKNKVENIHTFEPNYTRKTEAEEHVR
jgi:tRNA threonylcarbamoyladenosine biosynthesis protein TsaB